MGSIVYLKDKRVGITCACLSEPCHDPASKKTRAHQTLLGRVDENGGKTAARDEDTARLDKECGSPGEENRRLKEENGKPGNVLERILNIAANV